jgi:small neutral amino acid transporter SnatA (MarC family)
MGWHRFVGTSLLLYGLINPVGAVPIYSRLVRKSSADRTHQILLVASILKFCP